MENNPIFCALTAIHNRKRVILNPLTKDGWGHMVCPVCKSDITTGFRAIGAPKFAENCGREG